MMNEMKMWVNGQEIKIPLEMEKIFNQLMLPQLPEPKEVFQAPRPVQQQVIRRVIECKDTALRNVIIEMNKRLMKLEKLDSDKDKPKTIPSKPKTKVKPVVIIKPKPQKTSKVKSLSKQKVKDSKVSVKKKGSKKVVTKSKK